MWSHAHDAPAASWRLGIHGLGAGHVGPLRLNSRCPERKQVFSINHIVCRNSLGPMSQLFQLGNVFKAKFPEASQGSTLQADPSKDSGFNTSMLSLFCTNTLAVKCIYTVWTANNCSMYPKGQDKRVKGVSVLKYGLWSILMKEWEIRPIQAPQMFYPRLPWGLSRLQELWSALLLLIGSWRTLPDHLWCSWNLHEIPPIHPCLLPLRPHTSLQLHNYKHHWYFKAQIKYHFLLLRPSPKTLAGADLHLSQQFLSWSIVTCVHILPQTIMISFCSLQAFRQHTPLTSNPVLARSRHCPSVCRLAGWLKNLERLWTGPDEFRW